MAEISKPGKARTIVGPVGVIPTGPNNSITDVKGVEVGQITLIEGRDVRTGVTVVKPHKGSIFLDKVPAGICVGNGYGKLTGSTQLAELGEIETVLSQHEAVQQAVVIVREDTPGDKRLAAYCILKAGQSATPRELRSDLRDKLPAYMIPSAYVFLEAFPLTPNGKINRRALPAPASSEGRGEKGRGDPGSVKAQPGESAQAPSTSSERLIAEAWQKALNLPQVGIYDNFFDLGGHSLLAMQVVAEIKARSGCRLEPAYLRFETLGQLALTLDERLKKT